MELLKEIVITLSLSVVVVYIFSQINVPSIVGFILTGIIAGPSGLKLISAGEDVTILAEIGVILLLFTIGIEFSLKALLKHKRAILIGGILQVGITIIAGYSVSRITGLTINEALFMGFILSLSSTAIVLKLLQEKAEIETLHGNTTLSILIFQDIIIVPMMLVIPLLSGENNDVGASVLELTLKIVIVIAFVIVGARFIVPKLFFLIAKTKNKELFLMIVVMMCMLVPLATYSIGLSLSIGAFLSGLIISESEYSHSAFDHILPFKDVFTSFFFVSIGMMLNLEYLMNNIWLILVIVSGIVIVKGFIASFSVSMLRLPIKTIVIVGLSLSQIGEFSFILSELGLKHNLISTEHFQMFLSSAILTMMLTPFITRLSPKIAKQSLKLPLPDKVKTGISLPHNPDVDKISNHLVIIGYGLNGRNLSHSAKCSGIEYVIIEMNPETVRTERKNGESIHYGDATQYSILKHVKTETAKAVVIAINDPASIRKIVANVKKLNPTVYLIVRTRFIQEMNSLYKLGADVVIPEEFETSIEIFIRVLRHYLIPNDKIERIVKSIRDNNYSMFRNVKLDDYKLTEVPEINVHSVTINKNHPFVNKTLTETELRKKHKITVLAVQRNGEIISNPSPNCMIEENDILLLIGSIEKIKKIF